MKRLSCFVLSGSVMETTADNKKKIALYGADASVLSFDGHKITKLENGTSAITRMPIFKAGTFRDSWGEQQTWTSDHLRQMADNFALLKARDIFPNVPVRSDHSFSIDKVIGYVDGLSVSDDGQYLLADYTITEPPAAEKISRGTYRSRSAEIGMFETNSGEMYFPVLFGFAFVDIPAVEGLHSKELALSFFSLNADIDTTKELHLTTMTDDRGAPKPDASHNHASSTVATNTTTIGGLVTQSTSTSGLGAATPVVPLTTPAPARKFRVNGAEIEDADAVQSHINALEAFAKETRDGNRSAFVSSLATGKKIAATQVEALTALALDMSEDQFSKFKSAYEAAPVLSILAEHGNANGNLNGEGNAADEEIVVLKETIAQHRRAGLTEEQITKTASFKKLTALTATKN